MCNFKWKTEIVESYLIDKKLNKLQMEDNVEIFSVRAFSVSYTIYYSIIYKEYKNKQQDSAQDHISPDFIEFS